MIEEIAQAAKAKGIPVVHIPKDDGSDENVHEKIDLQTGIPYIESISTPDNPSDKALKMAIGTPIFTPQEQEARKQKAREQYLQNITGVTLEGVKAMQTQGDNLAATLSKTAGGIANGSAKEAAKELPDQIRAFAKAYGEMWLSQEIAGQILKGEKDGSLKVEQEKAAARAYVNKTFGNPEFRATLEQGVVDGVTTILNGEVGNVITRFSNGADNQLARFGEKIDNVNTKLDSAIDGLTASTQKLTTHLNAIGKLDALGKLNERLNTISTNTYFENKLGQKGILGRIGGIILDETITGSLEPIRSTLNGTKLFGEIHNVQSRILKVSTQLSDAVKKAQREVAKIKETIAKWKNRMYDMARSYVNRVVSSVRDALTSTIRGVTQKWTNTIKNNLKNSIKNSVKKTIEEKKPNA